MAANYTIALIRECSRITAILVIGVLAGFVVWFAAAWVLLSIVGALWPPSNNLDLTFPSNAQVLALVFVLLTIPVFVLAGGWMGWSFATTEKG